MPTDAICFVDDDPEEIRRFRRLLASRFVVGAGTSLPAALEDLRAQGRERPDVFALDLYFPEGEPNTDDERAELARAWERFLLAKAELAGVLARLRQSPDGGLALARRIAVEFPGVARRLLHAQGNAGGRRRGARNRGRLDREEAGPRSLERGTRGRPSRRHDAALARELPKVVRGLERALAHGKRVRSP